ncbi:MAG: NAD(P)-dependent oxidoreductase [Gammaproteobacteria bacterium]|nr:NAD(P)-dependent oxidoreductase [Gammaproteobacteria bacterium]
MQVAFLGLGAMGAPMAQRLVQGGHTVRGFDTAPAARERLAGIGGSPFDTAAAAAEGADAVITMLPDERIVESVLFGDQGAARAMRRHALLLEMSTSDADWIHTCAERLSSAGVRVMDVPVARGVREAAAGELLVMAGGDAADMDAARPLLGCFGRAEDVLHVGPRGSAIRLKLINNYLSMVNMVVAAEGLSFAALAGVPREMALRVLGATPAGRGQLLTNFPRKVLRGDVTPDFPLRLGLKDLSLALNLGARLGAPLHLGSAARQTFGLAARWGRAEEDCTAMLLLLEDLARVPHEQPAVDSNPAGT